MEGWRSHSGAQRRNGAERRNPGKPFHDEYPFAKGIIHLQKTAVQKITKTIYKIFSYYRASWIFRQISLVVEPKIDFQLKCKKNLEFCADWIYD